MTTLVCVIVETHTNCTGVEETPDVCTGVGVVTWGCPENVHHSPSTTKKCGGHVLLLTKPKKLAL